MVEVEKVITGYTSLQINKVVRKVVRKGNKLIFYYKKRWNKNYKTPNLGLSKILVQEITDYGVSRFYLLHDGSRSGEYTCVSWKYIKGKV